MAKPLNRFMDVDVVSFLEEKMKQNTKHYQSDFELDKEILASCARSQRKEDKTLLWLSRPHGTECVKEYDAFIRDSAAHIHWGYYSAERDTTFLAFAVEVIGEKDGVIRGNVYELDYQTHAAEVAVKAVPAAAVEKTFADGFVDRVSPDRVSYGYYFHLVAEHGEIVASRDIPADEKRLSELLADQKAARSKLRVAELDGEARKPSLDERIKYLEPVMMSGTIELDVPSFTELRDSFSFGAYSFVCDGKEIPFDFNGISWSIHPFGNKLLIDFETGRTPLLTNCYLDNCYVPDYEAAGLHIADITAAFLSKTSSISEFMFMVEVDGKEYAPDEIHRVGRFSIKSLSLSNGQEDFPIKEEVLEAYNRSITGPQKRPLSEQIKAAESKAPAKGAETHTQGKASVPEH